MRPTPRLYLRSMSDVEVRAIPGTELARHGRGHDPVFSPDGRSIAFWTGADRTLKRIAVTGGTPITICQADNPFGMNWAGDAIVFGQGPKGIMRVSANGVGSAGLVSVRDDTDCARSSDPAGWAGRVVHSREGDRVADRWDNAQLVVHALKSGDRKVLVEGGADARYVSTGHVVYAVGGTLFAVPFDASAGSHRGTGSGSGRCSPGGPTQTGAAHFSFSGAGRRFRSWPRLHFVRSAGSRVDRPERPRRTPEVSRGAYESPRLSPDGTRVAFESEDGKEAIVWVYDLAGTSAMRRLTFGGRNSYPVWSADGQRVTFQSDREQELGIFWQRADGTGTIERLTKPEPGTAHVPHAWAPKGDALLFSVTKGSDMALWTLSLSDRKVAPFGGVQSTSSFSPNAVFSPDGHWVAYASGWECSPAVFVQPFPATGAIYQVAGSWAHPLWSR